MINFNKEYYSNNYYFFLKDRGDKISLYYSVADTLTESRKNDKKMDFDKNQSKKVKDVVSNVLRSGKKLKSSDIEKKLSTIKKSGEIDELVDSDGTMLSSRIPIINLSLHPRKDMDQTVAMSRVTNDPITRGYRVYYGESEDKGDDVVSEVDYSDAFGYEETENKDYNETVEVLSDMGVENPEERADEFGKIRGQKRKQGRLKQRLSEKETIEERQKREMIKMVEDILTKKSKEESDVVKKDSNVSKILVKNLQSIKKLADKEGISINKLINILKKGE